MTVVTAQKITYLPQDMAGKRRIVVQLDDGTSVMLKFAAYPSISSIQNEVTAYETLKATEPTRIDEEIHARIRREMTEHGIIEKVD